MEQYFEVRFGVFVIVIILGDSVYDRLTFIGASSLHFSSIFRKCNFDELFSLLDHCS